MAATSTATKTDSTSLQCRAEAGALWESRDDDSSVEELLASWSFHPVPVPSAAVTGPFVQHRELGHHRERSTTLYSNVLTAGDVMSNGAFVLTLFSICALQ